MESECMMTNCRNLAPDHEAFCAKHRDRRERKLEDIPADELLVRLAVANEVIAEQLEIRKHLEADASRYRWLRDHSCPPHNFYIGVPDEFHGIRYSPSEVDAYIDAAITKQKMGDD